MLEFNDILLLTVINCIISALFCIIAAILLHYFRNRDVEALYVKVESLDMNMRGVAGRASRTTNNERTEEALGKIAVLVQSGKSPQDAIKEVAMAYPDVALQIGKKLMSGKLGI